MHNVAMNAHSILIIGCGDIGVELGRRLHQRGHTIYGVRRRPQNLPRFMHAIGADFMDAAELKNQLAPVVADYVIVTLTPSAFTADAYQRCFGAGTRNILAALGAAPKRLLFVSSTSVYHQSNGDWVGEHSATEPRQFSGRNILLAEKAVLSSRWPTTVVRFGGIYGPGRLRLIRQLQQGGPLTASLNFSNRIHRDDCAKLLEHLLLLDAQGADVADCYLGVDSEPAPSQEVQRYLARCLGLAPGVAAEDARQRDGNKRCSNRRIVASGFEFDYPNYRVGYQMVLQAEGLTKP